MAALVSTRRASLWLLFGLSQLVCACSERSLVIFESDGKMATYAAMVVACALALWWVGFRKRG